MRDKDGAFLQWAKAGAALLSTCAKRQHMAIILDAQGRFIGAGYNGSPPGVAHCIDGACPRAQENTPSGTSYDNCIAVHAEANALLFSDRTARLGGTLYVTGPPCWECSRLMAGSGLRRIVFARDRTFGGWERNVALLRTAGLQVVEWA